MRACLIIGAIWICSFMHGTVATAAPRVEFELVTERGLAPTAAHEWLAIFKNLDQQGLRIRGVEIGDEPAVDTSGTGDNAVHRVTGIISGGNILRFPGVSFRTTDKPAIAAWIAKLKGGGGGNEGGKRAAFGLTSAQLLATHEALAVPVSFVTRDQPARAVAQKIVRLLPLSVVLDESAQRVFGEAGNVSDELQNVSAGTALAALLRPLGLVLVPRTGRGDEVSLFITDVRNSEQNWPIGWPNEKDTSEALPALLKFLNVEIDNTPLTEALAAIQQRLEVPFLLDHNSLARQRIDLEKIKVTMPGGKTFYGKILDRMLWPSKLNWEVRIDEASKPFLWISTKIK